MIVVQYSGNVIGKIKDDKKYEKQKNLAWENELVSSTLKVPQRELPMSPYFGDSLLLVIFQRKEIQKMT